MESYCVIDLTHMRCSSNFSVTHCGILRLMQLQSTIVACFLGRAFTEVPVVGRGWIERKDLQLWKQARCFSWELLRQCIKWHDNTLRFWSAVLWSCRFVSGLERMDPLIFVASIERHFCEVLEQGVSRLVQPISVWHQFVSVSISVSVPL